jgi:hypothetical protein
VRDQVSHLYKTTGKIILLYILIVVFLDQLYVVPTLKNAWSYICTPPCLHGRYRDTLPLLSVTSLYFILLQHSIATCEGTVACNEVRTYTARFNIIFTPGSWFPNRR